MRPAERDLALGFEVKRWTRPQISSSCPLAHRTPNHGSPFSAASLPQRQQLRARADEAVTLRDRDAGAVECGVAVVFEIRGVDELEFAAAGLHHRDVTLKFIVFIFSSVAVR